MSKYLTFFADNLQKSNTLKIWNRTGAPVTITGITVYQSDTAGEIASVSDLDDSLESISTYANTLNDLATITANAYTDGVVSEAEEAAITAATEKAEAARLAAIEEAAALAQNAASAAQAAAISAAQDAADAAKSAANLYTNTQFSDLDDSVETRLSAASTELQTYVQNYTDTSISNLGDLASLDSVSLPLLDTTIISPEGYIATGLVAANSIIANAIRADHILAGEIGATHIASYAITAKKLAANSVTTDSLVADAITSTKIAAGAVTADSVSTNQIISSSANIGNSVVTTLKIGENEVTVPVTADASTTVNLINTPVSVISASITLTVSTQPVLILFSCVGYHASEDTDCYQYIYWYRGSTGLGGLYYIIPATGNASNRRQQMATYICMDTPGSGTTTYTIKMGGSGSVTQRNLVLLGCKR